MGTNGFIAPKTTEYMEAACQMNENTVLHPFAFRVHTHSLGVCQTSTTQFEFLLDQVLI